MKEICEFIVNNRIYTIYDVDKIEGKNSYVGRSDYIDTDIYIENGTFEQMLITLKHELCTFGYMKMGIKIKMEKKYLATKTYVN